MIDLSKYRNFITLFSIIALIGSCSKQKSNSYLLNRVAPEISNINFSNDLHPTPEFNILTYLYYYNGAGVAVSDFNNDGLQDIYLVANQNSNKLYINKGNLNFQDQTSKILEQNMGWSTGVTVVDVNQDGWKDIYLCEVGNYQSIQGQNKLFINKGLDDQGKLIFEENAKAYGLDIQSFATQSSFFDYDLDGDLDMFLVNHSVHPNRTYGRGSKRNQKDTLSGDRLFENRNGFFYDVTTEAGIFSGVIGYGLGVAISDVNNDRYPDIYITNDFFENDYLYLNQKNKTFKEVITSSRKHIAHTSHFSMGVDAADINNDNLIDILSVDMLPEDLITYKSSGAEYGYTIYNQYLKNGYQPQYMQNTMQLNQGNNEFNDVAHISGIAASEWSWAPLVMDLDNDGFKDVFITNGIQGATNDMDFIKFISNDKIQKQINKGMQSENLKWIDELPEKKTTNYSYKNIDGIHFKNTSGIWFENYPGFSNGAAYADFDNDGDLDLIVNNVNEKATLYENKKSDSLNQYIKVKLKGTAPNINTIGAKVILYTSKKSQKIEIQRTRGYLSSVPAVAHFGLGSATKIDSIQVDWPQGERKIYTTDTINTTLTLTKEMGRPLKNDQNEKPKNFVNNTLSLDFKHQDFETKDFGTEPLAPYAISNEGPEISILDFNKDQKDDIYVSGGRFQSGQLFVQDNKGYFIKKDFEGLDNFKKWEDVTQEFIDIDDDGDLDLIVGYGGNETLKEYQGVTQLFLNTEGNLKYIPNAFPKHVGNVSAIKHADIDLDGDIDVLITTNSTSGQYGQAPRSILYINQGNLQFKEAESSYFPEDLKEMIFDASFKDIDNDDYPDIVLVGHYMPIIILYNRNGHFSKENAFEIPQTAGWWNALEVADFDKDGDLDFIVGNWGLNSRLSASKEKPLRLYLHDFDDNGRIDPLLTYFYGDMETPLATKDELSKQLPELNKRFLSYTEFAKAEVSAYFPTVNLDEVKVRKVFELASVYIENLGNQKFEMKRLPWQAQLSTIQAIESDDINGDGYLDLILGGNSYEISTQLGSMDASRGLVLLNDKKGDFYWDPDFSLSINGQIRSIKKMKYKNEEYFVFGINNDSLQFIKKKY